MRHTRKLTSRIDWLVFHGTAGTALSTALVGLVAMLVTLFLLALQGIVDALTQGRPIIVSGGVGPPLFAALAIAGMLAVVTGLPTWLAPKLARAHARISMDLLTASPTEQRVAELTERVDILTETRSDALDAHGAELRRIERDLHDGAQAELVALTMRLGVAEQKLAEDPAAVAVLLKEARGGAEEAMTDLRDLVRTMYPPILADRGLAGAVSGLAARSLIPARVTIGDLGNVPAPVEAAAYFVIAEALTNAAKHSAATQILINVTRDYDGLHVEVLDDGVGGIDETQGTGIQGIHRRVAALDGHATIDSPLGGPSAITVELPCGW